MSCQFCPRCGYDIELDTPVLIDRFSMFGPGYPLCFEGRPIKLTVYESGICWSLMKAYPAAVKYATLLDRLDSEGTPNALNVFIHRIRHKLSELGIPNPIQTIRGNGYLWEPRGHVNETMVSLEVAA